MHVRLPRLSGPVHYMVFPHPRLQEFHEVFPHLITAADVPKLVKTGDVDWDCIDAAFCCLPHATTQVGSTVDKQGMQ